MEKCINGVPFDSECGECMEDTRLVKAGKYRAMLKANKYKRKVHSLEIDVYDVLKAFKVVNPAVQHAIKKLLCAGDRGYKDKVQDLKEANASIARAIELEIENAIF